MKNENIMEKGDVRFASGKKFVYSMRHQGLTDEEAIKEFIDNSFDADANNIWIEIWDENKKLSISVQDDGLGMNKELLERSLAFGETNNEDGSQKIGRFGFGMTTAIVSKTKNAEVFSKEKKGGYYYTIVDLNELEKDPTMKLYKPIEKNPDKLYSHIKKVDSGTFIVLKECDKSDFKKPDTIKKHLLEDLGMTYRYFIQEEKKIFVNGTPVELDDPLMSIKNHKYHKDLIKGLPSNEIGEDTGYSKISEIESIPVEYVDKDRNTKTGYIRIKLALLPMKDINRTAETNTKKWEKYRISELTQGFYVMRNNRQIKDGDMFIEGLKRHPSLNYFRGEVDFDSVLDDEFGIQVNKTRYNPSRSIRKKISDAVKPVIRTIVNEAQKISARIRAESEKDSKIAEEIAKESPYKTAKKIKEAKEEDVKKAEEKEIKKIEKDKDLNEETKKEKIENVRQILERQIPFTIDTEHNRQGPIFSWEFLGKTTKVILNREHPFYKYYWEASNGNTYFRTMLKILIFTLVKGEQIHQDELQDGNVITYQELHNHWNMILRKYLTSDRFISFAVEEFPEIEGYEDMEITE